MRVVCAYRLGTVEYEEACRLQERLARERQHGTIGDTLLLLQHPAVITIGVDGGEEDILAPAARLRQANIGVLHTDRGGRATYHGPGQLVAYPILKLVDGDLHGIVWRLEETAIRVLESFGLAAHRLEGYPGVWVDAADSAQGSRKIAALGLAVREGVTRHGLALNVAPQMAHFELLIPCGLAGRGVTSMECELGRPVDMAEVMERFAQAFGEVFDRRLRWGDPAALLFSPDPQTEPPPWLWQRHSSAAEAAVAGMVHLLADLRLHTVCQEARCPNIAECFGRGTATFMILGDICTRGCRFCAVRRGTPAPPDAGEPERLAEAVVRLGLRHVVVTSVTRDDLPDGGANHFAATVRAVRSRCPSATVELLIPDFNGSRQALETVLAAEPDVLNHNLETVPRLYPRVRPGADYRRSLGVLAWARARAPHMLTKSGLMLGLGERTAEVLQVLYDLRQARCDLLTLGQYLQPTEWQVPVARYLSPAEFACYRDRARALGFRGIAAGPLVRSSHQADVLWQQAGRPRQAA